MAKTLPTEKEFTLTEYQKGVIKTLNDVAIYLGNAHVAPIHQSISKTLTAYAQEHFKYPDGTELMFDIDPNGDGLVKVKEMENATAESPSQANQ